MTMIEVVQTLQAQGHHVDIYIRKDGGILVKNIDGQKFTSGAAGNARARQIAGASISEARVAQLKFATSTRQSRRRAAKLGKPTLDDEVKREWQRVKKKWNKAFKAKGGKPHPAGYFGWNRIQYALEHYGKDEALRRIYEAEKYTSGIAYAKNVEQLAEFVMEAGATRNSQELQTLAQDILDNAYMIREEWIAPAYDALYKLNSGEEPKQVAQKVRNILRLNESKNP